MTTIGPNARVSGAPTIPASGHSVGLVAARLIRSGTNSACVISGFIP